LKSINDLTADERARLHRISWRQNECPHDGGWKTSVPAICCKCGIADNDPRLKGTKFYVEGDAFGRKRT
jgi:hypothetical protein